MSDSGAIKKRCRILDENDDDYDEDEYLFDYPDPPRFFGDPNIKLILNAMKSKQEYPVCPYFKDAFLEERATWNIRNRYTYLRVCEFLDAAPRTEFLFAKQMFKMDPEEWSDDFFRYVLTDPVIPMSELIGMLDVILHTINTHSHPLIWRHAWRWVSPYLGKFHYIVVAHIFCKVSSNDVARQIRASPFFPKEKPFTYCMEMKNSVALQSYYEHQQFKEGKVRQHVKDRDLYYAYSKDTMRTLIQLGADPNVFFEIARNVDYREICVGFDQRLGWLLELGRKPEWTDQRIFDSLEWHNVGYSDQLHFARRYGIELTEKFQSTFIDWNGGMSRYLLYQYGYYPTDSVNDPRRYSFYISKRTCRYSYKKRQIILTLLIMRKFLGHGIYQDLSLRIINEAMNDYPLPYDIVAEHINNI